MTRSFTLFPSLLPEIRLLIWEYAIQPRVTTFVCELYNFNPRHAPQSLYLVGGDPPYEHFEIDVPQRPTSPYYLVQCFPSNVASTSMPLLNTCHESRQVALGCGYKPWRLENEALGTRDWMWNPRLDVISLGKIHKRQDIDELCLDVFMVLFREQAREIQRLVVETDHWPPGRARRDVTEWARLLEFSDLVELAVLVEPYKNRSEDELAGAAEGIRSCLETAKKRRMEQIKTNREECRKLDAWFPSRIQVVRDGHDLLDGV